MRTWNFTWDMNGDGIVTISDVWAWIGWLFFYPGDYLLSLVIENRDLARFLELDYTVYGGWISGVLSGLAWIIALLVWGVLLSLWDEATTIYTARHHKPADKIEGDE